MIKRTHILAAAVAISCVAAAPAYAAPQWLSPQTVSGPGFDASHQQVAFDGSGDAVSAWEATGGPHPVIQATFRAAGGSFSSPQTLSDPTEDSATPAVAIDPRGDAVVVWTQTSGASHLVEASYRPAGGSFGSPQTLSAPGYTALAPRVALDDNGNAVAVWSLLGGGGYQIQAAAAAAAEPFGAASNLGPVGPVEATPQVAFDHQGDAIAVWLGNDGSNRRVQEAVRPAGQTSFGTAPYLSAPAVNAASPQLAFDAAGDAVVVFTIGTPSVIRAAYRPAGGDFALPAQTVSAPSPFSAVNPEVAFDATGSAVVVWNQAYGAYDRVHASVRGPGVGGSFSTPTLLDGGGQDASDAQIAGDGRSGTIVAWQTFNGANNQTQAVVRPAGGSFSAPVALSPAAVQNAGPDVVGIDDQGNGVAVWSQFTGADYTVQVAGYDGAGPQLRGLSVPTTGTVGEPLSFAVSPVDVWNPVASTTIAFGDGSTVAGTSASHTYLAPGSYQVTITSTDTLGNATSVVRTLVISPAGGGSTASGGASGSQAAGPVGVSATRCTLSAHSIQRLLHERRVTATVTCTGSVQGRLGGSLAVYGHRRGGHALTRLLHSYGLTGQTLHLDGARHIMVSLGFSRRALSGIRAAFDAHDRVALALSVSASTAAERARLELRSIAR